MTKKYLLLPGYVRSKTDGQSHYVSADQLVRLYGVDWRECVVGVDVPELDKLIVLMPRRDGNYAVPKS